MNRKRIFGILLAWTVCLILWVGAGAEGIRETIGLLKNWEAVSFEITAAFEKLPQFDENRCEQLNRLLRHIRFCGQLEAGVSDLTVYADGDPLFSVAVSDIGGKKRTVLSPDGERRWLLPETEGDAGDSVTQFLDVFREISRQLEGYDSLGAVAAFIEKLPDRFPQAVASSKMNEKYKDYGTAVKKVSVKISAEELTACVRDHRAELPEGDGLPDIGGIVFEGRQDFEMLMTEEGKALKIRYGGKAGLGAEDLRTVRLDWKTVRSDSVDRDEMTLKTPDSAGTRRNNLILAHTRRKSEDGKETFQWKAETDEVSEGIRTRGVSECTAEAENGILAGSFVTTRTVRQNAEGCEIRFEMSGETASNTAGTLEIISKKDKIETGRLKANISLRRDASAAVTEDEGETAGAEREITGENLQELISKIVGRLMRLDPEDLVFLTEGIPEEPLRTLLPND